MFKVGEGYEDGQGVEKNNTVTVLMNDIGWLKSIEERRALQSIEEH